VPAFQERNLGVKEEGWLYVALLVDLGHQGASTRRVVSIPSTNCYLLLILDLCENCNFITNVSIICSSDITYKYFGVVTYLFMLASVIRNETELPDFRRVLLLPFSG